jgi:lysophospholipase L1-like esterase
MTKIIVFGNSIGEGYWDLEGGWVDRLRKNYHKKSIKENNDLTVYNQSISGASTKDILDRFEFEIKPRIRGDKIIIILATGVNDSQWLNDENKWRVSQEEFKDQLQKLIDLSKKYSNKIIFLGLTKTKDGDPIPGTEEKSYKNERVEIFDKILKEKSQENNINFIDTSNLIENNDLKDYVHPNTEGHKKIFNKVKNFLEENKLL